jgi:SAM-dependent methyltransferase
MKNEKNWVSTKFEIESGNLIPSKNIALSSFRMASYIGRFYSEALPNFCSGKLLDLGCGKVPFYGFYNRYTKEVTCADWDNSYHGNEYLDLVCDLNKELPIDSNNYDTVILSDVLEHLENPKFTLFEIQRILKEGGHLILNFPFLYGIHEGPFDYGRYTKFQIYKWAEELNMVIVVEKEFGGLIDMTEHSVLRIVKSKFGGRIFEKILFFLFNLINRKVNGQSNHPYMYGFVLKKGRI